MTKDIDESMHDDGSPLGNASIFSDAYAGLGLCPDKECPSLEKYFKCYRPGFIQCVTYIERNVD